VLCDAYSGGRTAAAVGRDGFAGAVKTEADGDALGVHEDLDKEESSTEIGRRIEAEPCECVSDLRDVAGVAGSLKLGGANVFIPRLSVRLAAEQREV
jgi:hypothetical protein